MDLVHLHRDALPIVPDLNSVPLWVNLHLNATHAVIVLVVVRSVHQDLVCKESEAQTQRESEVLTENLVESGNVGDLLVGDPVFSLIVDPEVLLVEFDAADVGVWPQENVLQLGLLLVDFLNVVLASPLSHDS